MGLGTKMEMKMWSLVPIIPLHLVAAVVITIIDASQAVKGFVNYSLGDDRGQGLDVG